VPEHEGGGAVGLVDQAAGQVVLSALHGSGHVTEEEQNGDRGGGKWVGVGDK
jgi:hypothetical protein